MHPQEAVRDIASLLIFIPEAYQETFFDSGDYREKAQ